MAVPPESRRTGTSLKVALSTNSVFRLTGNPNAVETPGEQAGKEQREPCRVLAGVGVGVSCTLSVSRRAVSTRDSSCPPPATPTDGARGALARAPQPARTRALPASARPAPAGSSGAVAAARSWQGLPPGHAVGDQRVSWGLSAPASPARPQQAPQPWPGLEQPLLAAPCPGRTDTRPVTCAQVLGRSGQRCSHGSRTMVSAWLLSSMSTASTRLPCPAPSPAHGGPGRALVLG
uniref:Verprolin-like n=1 Tax=Castor canadensis TaxID=51338 RepID=A0A8B7TND0_CASCN|nr:verprolin-like [Castor canadensis]